MKKALFLNCIIFLYTGFLHGQTAKGYKEYHLISNYQKIRVQDGTIKVIKRKVDVYFKDPAPLLKNTDDVDRLPIGILNLKWDDGYEIKNEVKYFGKFDFGATKNQSLYGITKTNTTYNIFVFVKRKNYIDGIPFNHILLIGETDPDKPTFPKIFTIVGCN